MTITWLQPALDSLSDVVDYSIEYFGTRQATNIVDNIYAAVEKLYMFPLIGPVIPEISNEATIYRRLKINKLLSVIYRVHDDTIYIIFVWDNRRSLHNIFYTFNNY